jgi:Zn-dependent protease/CBS domain-containing protein
MAVQPGRDERKRVSMPGSLYVGTIAGIRVTIHSSWLILLALFTVTLATGWFPQALPGLPTATYWLTGFVAALLLCASVLGHELAHSLVARARGVPVKQITLFLFGGSSHLAEEPRSPGVEFQVTVVGPLASIFLGGLAWLAHGLLLASAPLAATVFGYLAIMNGLLAAFNLVPGFPLDGGRILRSLLWKLNGSFQTATRWSAQVGKLFAAFFIITGVWLAIIGSLLSGVWLGIIGWFLWVGAQAALVRATQQRPTQEVTVERAMRPVPLVVSPSMSLQDLMDIYIRPRGLAAVPVMGREHLVGMITLDDMQQVPYETWEQALVGQIMVPRERLHTVSPQQPLREALSLMDQHNLTRVLVTQDHQLVGMVSRDEIALLMVQQGLGAAETEADRANYLRKAS